MVGYDRIVAEAFQRIREIMPWDLSRMLAAGDHPILQDVCEPSEFALLHIPDSINVPRGVLEQSCEWDYDETVPALAAGREQEIIVICRSGKRSVLPADTLQCMGYVNVVSLKTGVRGWNDYEQPLQDGEGNSVDADSGDERLVPRLRTEQRKLK